MLSHPSLSWLTKAVMCFVFAFSLLISNASALELKPQLVVSELVAPIGLSTLPDGSNRKLILDQSGVIHLLNADESLSSEPFLDIRKKLLDLEEGFEERGLLGMAVHPDYASNGKVFVTYTAPLDADAPGGWNYTRVVSEFTVSAENDDKLDIASERVLMRQHWPSRKHNGGALAFSLDGLLYIGFGDGGGIHGVGPTVLNDAFNVPTSRLHWDGFAQDVHSLYGKILRIDVDAGYPGYAIPEGNPFIGKPGRDEIYAWGFRNPYRLSFDPNANGSFYITAVAETLWEAIYHVKQPGNYGWPLREGKHCFDRTKPLSPPVDCSNSEKVTKGFPIIDPVVEYPNMSVHREGSTVKTPGVGTAVVGAVMNRGDRFGEWQNKLLFADWSLDFQKPSGQLFAATPSDESEWVFEKVAELETRIVSLTQDSDGSVYVLTNENFGPYGNTGKVFRLY